MLGKMANVIVRTLLIIFERSCNQEIPQDLKKANITPTFKKGKNEHLVNYTEVILTLVLGKVMEQIILETIFKLLKKKVTGSNQHRFMKGISYLIHMISF